MHTHKILLRWHDPEILKGGTNQKHDPEMLNKGRAQVKMFNIFLKTQDFERLQDSTEKNRFPPDHQSKKIGKDFLKREVSHPQVPPLIN